MTSHHPSEFSNPQLDTALLEQIIETEIDIAIHTLRRERRIQIDDTVRHTWLNDVLDIIVAKIAGQRCLLPHEIDRTIDVRIRELIEEYLTPETLPDCGSMLVPMHGFFPLRRHALVLCRKFFEKRLE